MKIKFKFSAQIGFIFHLSSTLPPVFWDVASAKLLPILSKTHLIALRLRYHNFSENTSARVEVFVYFTLNSFFISKEKLYACETSFKSFWQSFWNSFWRSVEWAAMITSWKHSWTTPTIDRHQPPLAQTLHTQTVRSYKIFKKFFYLVVCND